MSFKKLNDDELEQIKVGAVSLLGIMTIIAAAVMAVVVYKLFLSSKGSATIPGGWKFTWN